MTRRLDVGQIVLVASAATGLPTDALVDDTDTTLLALITQRTRSAPDAATAVAEMLVGVAAGRPFPERNTAAAWALAALVADSHRLRLDLDPTSAVTLSRDAASGRAHEADVAARLAPALVGVGAERPRRAARVTSETWACPKCGRPVREAPFRSSILLVEPAPDDVVADCAARSGAHGPNGVVRRYPPVERWVPSPLASPLAAPSMVGAR